MGSSKGGSGEQERIPRLAPDLDPEDLELTPGEGFLLSRIDGATSWKTLCHIGGLSPLEVDRALERFEAKGVIVVDAKGQARAAKAATAPAEPKKLVESKAQVDAVAGQLAQKTSRHLRASGVVNAREDHGVHERSSFNQRNAAVAAAPPASWATMNPGASAGRMPANVSLAARASVTAGLANDVDAVNQ